MFHSLDIHGLIFVDGKPSLATYVAAAGLSGPLAGIYYTVEVGTRNVTVESTSAVNPSTLSVTSTIPSSGAGTSTGTASATQTTGAAVKVGPATLGGSLMGFLGMVALLA